MNSPRILLCALLVAGLASLSSADVLTSGDVNPTPATTWDSQTSATVGDTGTGQVTMTESSSLAVYSLDLGYDSGSNGTIAIYSGADLTADQTTELALAYGSVGTLTVDGTGSTFTQMAASDMHIGCYGDGTLNITNGGIVNTNAAQLGSTGTLSYGEVNVSGAGSAWNGEGGFVVAYNGQGELNILAGGTVSAASLYVGRSSGADGTVTVSGTDSILATTATDVIVGYNGSGAMAINDGGLVAVKGTLTIDNSGSGGVINMKTGGMLAIYGDYADLSAYLGAVQGTDNINYWDGDSWEAITSATEGVDYEIYAGTGDLASYTVLEVPEPATMGLMAVGSVLFVLRRRRPEH